MPRQRAPGCLSRGHLDDLTKVIQVPTVVLVAPVCILPWNSPTAPGHIPSAPSTPRRRHPRRRRSVPGRRHGVGTAARDGARVQRPGAGVARPGRCRVAESVQARCRPPPERTAPGRHHRRSRRPSPQSAAEAAPAMPLPAASPTRCRLRGSSSMAEKSSQKGRFRPLRSRRHLFDGSDDDGAQGRRPLTCAGASSRRHPAPNDAGPPAKPLFLQLDPCAIGPKSCRFRAIPENGLESVTGIRARDAAPVPALVTAPLPGRRWPRASERLTAARDLGGRHGCERASIWACRRPPRARYHRYGPCRA